MPTPLPQLASLTSVGIQLTAAVEIELRGNLSFLDVYRAIGQGTLLREIERVAPRTCDFSEYPAGSAQCAALHEALRRASAAVDGKERRTLGLIASGMHLALALVLEAIRQGHWAASQSAVGAAPAQDAG